MTYAANSWLCVHAGRNEESERSGLSIKVDVQVWMTIRDSDLSLDGT